MLIESSRHLIQTTHGTVFFDMPCEMRDDGDTLANTNLLASIYSHCKLLGRPFVGAHYANISCHELYVFNNTGGRDRYNLLTGAMPSSLWHRIPFESHQVAKDAVARLDCLRSAIERIVQHHADIYPTFTTFVRNIVWTELVSGYEDKDTLITSVSFPTVPFSIFLSKKAFLHIPPNTVVTHPSVRFLAENLVHEAIHQQVNVTLLERDIFCADYSSTTSPKIPITWRMNQDIERNQYWEIDRTLHATAVYITLMAFRRTELRLPVEDDCESHSFRQALSAGMHALDYLSCELLKHKDQFTTLGACLIETLRLDALREIEACQHVLDASLTTPTGEPSAGGQTS